MAAQCWGVVLCGVAMVRGAPLLSLLSDVSPHLSVSPQATSVCFMVMGVKRICLMLFIQIWKGWLCKDQRKMVLV